MTVRELMLALAKLERDDAEVWWWHEYDPELVREVDVDEEGRAMVYG